MNKRQFKTPTVDWSLHLDLLLPVPIPTYRYANTCKVNGDKESQRQRGGPGMRWPLQSDAGDGCIMQSF